MRLFSDSPCRFKWSADSNNNPKLNCSNVALLPYLTDVCTWPIRWARNLESYIGHGRWMLWGNPDKGLFIHGYKTFINFPHDCYSCEWFLTIVILGNMYLAQILLLIHLYLVNHTHQDGSCINEIKNMKS